MIKLMMKMMKQSKGSQSRRRPDKSQKEDKKKKKKRLRINKGEREDTKIELCGCEVNSLHVYMW